MCVCVCVCVRCERVLCKSVLKGEVIETDQIKGES